MYLSVLPRYVGQEIEAIIAFSFFEDHQIHPEAMKHMNKCRYSIEGSRQYNTTACKSSKSTGT